MTGGPGQGGLEGGGEVEHGPGEDDVVVGAEEEGDDHCAHPGTLQDGTQLVQGSYGASPGILANCKLHEQQGNSGEIKMIIDRNIS